MQRIQKIIAEKGFCSRRKAEILIREGHVKCNGETAKLGQKVTYEDIITIYDNPLSIKKLDKKIYIMLNKPRGYISTLYDERNRKTIMMLLTGIKQRVYPVGRLDLKSQGLMILTNDGELAAKLMHPSSEIVKTYKITIKKNITREQIEKMENGVFLDGKKTAPCKITILENSDLKSVLIFNIHEGKKRHIRRIIEKILNCEVRKLKRTAIGPLKLGNLKIGRFRFLTQEEIDLLKTACKNI